MATQIIPLLPRYADEFDIDLEEDETWHISYRWNQTYGAWFMDLSSEQAGIELLGLCLVGGSNLLQPHAVTELGMMFVVDTEGKGQNPDFDLLGDGYKLLYVPKADIL